MSHIITFLSEILGYVMRACYSLIGNYGLSIILFTLLTKVLLFPLSIMTQKNSIKMVNLQPKLDELKIKYIDDKDKYTDEQVALYKKYKYNPFLDMLPLLLQIPIVLGLVGVIYRPLSYVLSVGSETVDKLNSWLINTVGISDAGSTYQITIAEKLRAGLEPPADVSRSDISSILGLDMTFLGIDLGKTPSFKGNYILLLIPLLAGLSAWLLCFAQNRLNVLQIAQGKLNKIATTVFMVAFSTYFALIVPCGVGLYWIFGNLFAIPLMVVTNLVIPPKKYVDYNKLMLIKQQKKLKEEEYSKHKKREAADYKRFFSNKDMQLMFYSESNGFFKYYEAIISYICEHSDIVIHYVTSDPNDNIFKDPREQIRSYYVSSDRYLIPLFMKLDCDMCVMTVPDLEKYHIKRSRVRKDIEYVFACHGMGSISFYRKGALDWFDTILCPGIDQFEEIRAYEKLYKTPEKLIVETGYPLIDSMLADYESREHPAHERPQILIAPSWQPENIIELCAEKLLDELSKGDYDIILRPHPQQVRHEPERFEQMKEKYASFDNIEIQTDFSITNPVMESDLLITDWSDIACEFAFVTKHPVVYIDTPMKIMNHDYEQINIEPMNKRLRPVMGKVVAPDALDDICELIDQVLSEKEQYSKAIDKAFHEHVYNVGKSAVLCGKYIIRSINKRTNR
ncbi:MAG: membrane protein insertase YidC [Ruminococcus sp.]|nr:membrane protein insertase YidC [Ruminococcus sp.]